MNAYREGNHLVATNSELRSLLGRRASGEELDQAENAQVSAFVVGIINIWIATEEAFDNGIVSDRLFSVYTSDVERSISLFSPEQWKVAFETVQFMQDYEFSRIILEIIDSQRIQ